MAQLIPTPVTKADLRDIASDINTMNDGTTALVDQPRTRPTDIVTVEVTDDIHGGAPAYWEQRHLTGEWVRSGAKLGYAEIDADGDDWVIVPTVQP